MLFLLKLQINPTNYIVLCEINSLSAPKLIKIVIEQIQRYENNKLQRFRVNKLLFFCNKLLTTKKI